MDEKGKKVATVCIPFIVSFYRPYKLLPLTANFIHMWGIKYKLAWIAYRV